MMIPREKDRAFHAGMKKDGLGIWEHEMRSNS